MKRLTTKAWFGPKRYAGWGWRVSSWQGFVILIIYALLILLIWVSFKDLIWAVILSILVTTGFVIVAMLTGDPPGGP